MTETEKQDGMAKSEIADGMCDMDDLMAELSEDELAELTELEELYGCEEAWLDEDEEDGEEGTLQEGIPTSDWLTDSPDDGQGETSRTEETEQADEDEDPYDQIVDGYIYLITNLVNGKQYVGQTTKTIEWRWRQHINTATSETKSWKTLIDRAIKKYGAHNFCVEELEHLTQVSRTTLDKREVYWIQAYQTCVRVFGHDAGYNVLRGGRSIRTLLSKTDELHIVDMYQNNITVKEIARKYKISPETVHSVIEKYHLESRNGENYRKFVQMLWGMRIVCYCDAQTAYRQFASSREAAEWLIHHGYSKSQFPGGVASALRYAAARHGHAYGFLWDLPDVSENDKQKIIEYRKTMQKRRNNTSRKLKKQCMICGDAISDGSLYCLKHASLRTIFDSNSKQIVKTHQHLDEYPGAVPILGAYPLSEQTAKLLVRFYNLSEIALMYGVHANNVKRFMQDYYGIDCRVHAKYRMWNVEYESYEYYSDFPLSLRDIQGLSNQGATLTALAEYYHINTTTLKKYLFNAFGKTTIQNLFHLVSKQDPIQPRAVIDLNSGVQTNSMTEMAQHIIKTCPEAQHDTVKAIAERLRHHLVKKSKSTYECYGYLIQLA